MDDASGRRALPDDQQSVWAYQTYYRDQTGVEFNLAAISAAAKHLAAMIRKRCPIVGEEFPFERQHASAQGELMKAVYHLRILLDYSNAMPVKFALHINAIRAFGHPQRAAATPIQNLWDTYHGAIAPAMAKAQAAPLHGTLAEFERRTIDALERAAAELDECTAELCSKQQTVIATATESDGACEQGPVIPDEAYQNATTLRRAALEALGDWTKRCAKVRERLLALTNQAAESGDAVVGEAVARAMQLLNSAQAQGRYQWIRTHWGIRMELRNAAELADWCRLQHACFEAYNETDKAVARAIGVGTTLIEAPPRSRGIGDEGTSPFDADERGRQRNVPCIKGTTVALASDVFRWALPLFRATSDADLLKAAQSSPPLDTTIEGWNLFVNGIVRRAWAYLRQIPGTVPPQEPKEDVVGLAAARHHLDAVIRWCEKQSQQAAPVLASNPKDQPTTKPGRPALPDEAWLSPVDLASHYSLNPENLRKRLDGWRKKHAAGDGWKEVAERGPREPKYLYRVGAVRSVVEDMADTASGETSG